MSITSEQSTSRIVFLDYARIFAFTSVLIGHLFNDDLKKITTDDSVHLFFRLTAQITHDICAFGGAGVIVFFITSGYIISHVIRTESATEFIVRRIFRIYPLFIVAILAESWLMVTTGSAPAPQMNDMIPRLLLLGDFFNTPYGLGGVEWTLRVEILFYVFMAILKASGIFRHPKFVPTLVFLISLVILYLPEFPNSFGWTDGYFNIFFPFLIIGILFYYLENSNLKSSHFIIFSATIFLCSLLKSQSLQPKLNNSNFSLIALLVFSILWYFRRFLNGNFFTKTLSETTYAVYLLHLWSWTYLGYLVDKYGIDSLSNRTQRLVLLIAISLLATKTIEKYGIKIGRLISRKLTSGKQTASTT